MTYYLVYAVGATCSLMFFFLFMWLRRENHSIEATVWWSAAAGFSFISRMMFFLFPPGKDHYLVIAWYLSASILESTCLLLGFMFLLERKRKLSCVIKFLIFAELWLIVLSIIGFNSSIGAIVVSVYNSIMLYGVAYFSFVQSHLLRIRMLYVVLAASLVLSIYWFIVTALITLHPAWLLYVFVFGIVLSLLQYFSLFTVVLRLFQDKLLRAEDAAVQMSFTDPLTGLKNKRFLSMRVEEKLFTSGDAKFAGVFYIDLDDFKPINDREGHATGDLVLKEIACRIRLATRSSDICFRLGGDEFAVICPRITDVSKVNQIAEKLQRTLENPIKIDEKIHNVSASIGVSIYPRNGCNINELLKKADEMMYQVKKTGKNGCMICQG